MPRNIRVGTASWTDPTLIKSKKFYPRGCSSAEDRLKYYASQFPIVEVDSSYYALPSSSNAEKWAERTPPDFVFNLKSFRLFTGHQTPRQALPKDIGDALATHFAAKANIYYRDVPVEIRDELWRRFDLGVQPLREAGKLGALHFQFAPWIQHSTKSIEHLEECQARLPNDILAMEFRDRSWFDDINREQVLAMLRTHGWVNVVVDEPQQSRNSIPSVWEATSPHLAIVRLHGRNAETWNLKGDAASDRFNYDYTDEELRAFVPLIQTLARFTSLVAVLFNNNYEDQGQRNAYTLIRQLDEA